MEELIELRELLQKQDYENALLLIDELEEMSKEDKLSKIYSYVVVLLVHLIKQSAEQRTTRSWDFSIYNSVKNIKRVNQRKRSGGVYANREQLVEIIEDAFDIALKKAALEAFGGIYSEQKLSEQFDELEIRHQAITFLSSE
ncbi:MAG: DUF29 family protein [Cyanobacteriota bacterium]|jgi:hypothetical protein